MGNSFDRKVAVTIEIDINALRSYTDEHLVACWHLAQANPASIDDPQAGELAEEIGREIIRRWLTSQPPELWKHQGRHYYWGILSANGKWGDDGEWRPAGTTSTAQERSGDGE